MLPEEALKRMTENKLSDSEILFLAKAFNIPEEYYSQENLQDHFFHDESNGSLKTEALRGAFYEIFCRKEIGLFKYQQGHITGINNKNAKIIHKEEICEKSIKKLGIPIQIPDYPFYNWQKVVFWNLGNFGKLLKTEAFRYGCLIIPEVDCVIFPKEIDLLRKMDFVIVEYCSAWNLDLLEGNFLGYKLDEEEQLLKIIASYFDRGGI